MSVVGDICRRDVIYTERETTVVAATKLMRHYPVGTFVLVDAVDGQRVPAGILTDRDIVMGIDAVDLDPEAITMDDMMSRVSGREREIRVRRLRRRNYQG